MHGTFLQTNLRKLGWNEHIKSLKRSVIPKRPYIFPRRPVFARVIDVFFKWDVNEYPGYGRILGQILAVNPETARKVARGEKPLSDKGRARLINWLEGQLFELQSIIQALKDEQTALDFKRTHDPKYNRTARLIKARAALAAKQGQPTRKSKP